MTEDEDNFVMYGEPFDEEDPESINYSHSKVRSQAYERRVLNERGRPMRFHGAFTGGFSAGFFNTVGSKKGFKPQSFTSSRRNRSENTERPALAKPEDFMDEEDLGEFGIAPRLYRTRHEFDDSHIFITLSDSIGGKSVIPNANYILKRMLIPTGTSLADRLLRRLGWKSGEVAEVLHEEEEVDQQTVIENTRKSEPTTEREYAVISFAPKANTFGLGYSGLDPAIAFGRRASTLRLDPQSESVAGLQRRERVAKAGFNPSAGLVRQGIRGQAFGVGALHTEDADIYEQESMAAYDFSIGENDDEEYADDEMAELEAARHGRFSDLRRRGTNKPKSTTIDGWTPPTLPKVSLSGVEEEIRDDLLEGFVKPTESGPLLALTNSKFFVVPKPVTLPPGYMPVFHPECLGPQTTQNDQTNDLRGNEAAQMQLPAPLLKPFVGDSAKQARFETYQLMRRQGLSHEEAYGRCSSGCIDLTEKTRDFEGKVFATLLRNLAPAKVETNAAEQTTVERDTRPLTTGVLDADKQRLVANLLKSRFRSAGSMDFTKELTEAQEEERRKYTDSLDLTDPRDNAAANDSYGVLTRRSLVWHPAALLCKRFNVPNPYPDSKFVGCPEDCRMRRLSRRGGRCGRAGSRGDVTSGEFSLFQLLDINVGGGGGSRVGGGADDFNTDEDDCEVDSEQEKGAEEEGSTLAIEGGVVTSTNTPSGPSLSVFDALFADSDKAEQQKPGSGGTEALTVPSHPPSTVATAPSKPRVVGPAAPSKLAKTSTDTNVPSMNLFKSIFASDEEDVAEDIDDADDFYLDHELRPPTQRTSQMDPVVHSSRDQGDDGDDVPRTEPPLASAPSQSSASDLSVHQLFKHLFNPEMDSEAPLFAVSKVTNQKKEERRVADEEGQKAGSINKTVSDEAFYGPALPPDFGPTGSSNFESVISSTNKAPSTEDFYVVERKKRRCGDADRERRSHRHDHKHHRRHKHKHHKREQH